MVQVVVLSQDSQGQPQRILARPQMTTDLNLGKQVIIGIGEDCVSLTPEIKPRPKL